MEDVIQKNCLELVQKISRILNSTFSYDITHFAVFFTLTKNRVWPTIYINKNIFKIVLIRNIRDEL